MNMRSMRSMFIYLLIAVGVMAIFLTVFKEPFGGSSEIPISRMISLASENKLESIEISGDSLTAIGSDGSQYTSRKESGSSIVEQLEVAGVSSGANYMVEKSTGKWFDFKLNQGGSFEDLVKRTLKLSNKEEAQKYLSQNFDVNEVQKVEKPLVKNNKYYSLIDFTASV